jgi:hypothetical protein
MDEGAAWVVGSGALGRWGGGDNGRRTGLGHAGAAVSVCRWKEAGLAGRSCVVRILIALGGIGAKEGKQAAARPSLLASYKQQASCWWWSIGTQCPPSHIPIAEQGSQCRPGKSYVPRKRFAEGA